ncbi:hypothetical protein [Bradyrhizobium liaoningense]
MRMPAVRRGLRGRLAEFFDRLGDCGSVGFVIGLIAGGLLTVLSFMHPHMRPAADEVLWIILILSVFCWLVVVFISIVFVRLQLRSVMAGMLARSILICTLTVLIAHILGAYSYGIVIGILVGLLLGFALCRMLRERRV